MKYPPQWYNFDEALKKSMIGLVADSKWLSFTLVSSYVFTLGAFGALIAYYKTVSTTESTVHDKYTLDGYTCRPLQRDPDYGLQITYDECMAEHYASPTVDNLVSYGDYGPQVYEYSDSAVNYHNDGPWNFQETGINGDGSPRSSLQTLTVYHKPFPTLTNQTITLHEMCRVPFYKGYEKHSAYGFAAIDDAVRYAVERGSLNFDAYGGFSGYSSGGLTNHDLNLMDGGATIYPNPSQNIFKLATDTKFVATCGTSNFSTAYEQAVLANGTYVFPHGFGGDMTIWEGKNTWDEASGTILSNILHILLKRNSFGMTPLYPVVPYNGDEWAPSEYISEGMKSSMTATTFFGAPRCPYFEKEVSRQAYEYIYSLDNCHPCDSFKFNSPFFCERQVYKTNAEIVTLASSNAMALSAAIISITPLLLACARHRKSNADTQSPAPDDDIMETRI